MVPAILLVEDDPVTCAFLLAAIEALPAKVDTANSVAAADGLARVRDYDLWLIDANLPDGQGTDLLSRLRGSGLRTPALAHTAAHERGALEALVEAGFLDALVKPMPAAVLQAAIRGALGSQRPDDASGNLDAREHPATQAWDDAAALAALNGQRAHVDALRKLFLDELPAARDRIRNAAQAGDVDDLRDALHKLRASCGFVGAARLQATVRALQSHPESSRALARFVEAAQEVLSSA